MSEHLQYLRNYLVSNIKNEALDFFLTALKVVSHPRILEIGTRRWGPNPTHHKALFPEFSEYIMTDIQEGIDVDVVSDAHQLSEVFGKNSFDVIWSSSTWEHLHSPWIAANEVLEVLKPGGLFFIQTHFQFPEHGYPFDYFRFSREALEHIFNKASKKVSCYEFEAKMMPVNQEIVWNPNAKNWLNVCISGIS